MVSPKYSKSHFLYPYSHFTDFPHTISLYVDYNCRFSAKLFLKFRESVIPELEKQYPGKFQFVYNHVIQPWHPNSVFQNEFGLSIAKLIRESGQHNSELFWAVSESLFKNIIKFYDNANSDKGRNEIYSDIYDVVSGDIKLPFTKEQVLANIAIKQVESEEDFSQEGNALAVDFKYFTRYQRTVGVHITPTVYVNGIVAPSIESSTAPEKVVEIFASHL